MRRRQCGPLSESIGRIMATGVTEVRLTEHQRGGIRRAVARTCDEMRAAWRRIILFGSRVDRHRRGGDIDLLIELNPVCQADRFALTQKLRLALEDELGERRVDVVVDDGHGEAAFLQLARATGVELWSNT